MNLEQRIRNLEVKNKMDYFNIDHIEKCVIALKQEGYNIEAILVAPFFRHHILGHSSILGIPLILNGGYADDITFKISKTRGSNFTDSFPFESMIDRNEDVY